MAIEPIHPTGRRLRNLERLRAYVLGAKASGHTKKEVTAQLENFGWKTSDVGAVWPSDELNHRKHGLAVLILLGILLIVMFLAKTPPSVTGAFFSGGGADWEFLSEVNATNSEQQVLVSVPFGVFRPVNCADGILVLYNSSSTNFNNSGNTISNGRCVLTSIIFSNTIFDNSTNATSTATYQIYHGKVEQIAEFTPQTPENRAQLIDPMINVWAALALPAVASLEWNSVNETLTGNGTTWWITKTNLTPGNYSAIVFAPGAHTEKRVFTILAPLQEQQNQTQNQTNQTPITQLITFVSPTPANGATVTSNQVAITTTLALPANSVILRTIFGRDGNNSNGTWSNYTMDGSGTSWSKNLILANGKYEVQVFEGNISSEIITFAVDYLPPQVKAATVVFTATSPEDPAAQATFTAAVKNMGNSTIDALSGKINIYKSDGSLAEIVNLSAASSLSAGGSQSLTGGWKATNAGKYKATATVNYDSKSVQAITDFQVGAKTLEITKSNAMQSGNDVEFLIGLKNKWIEDITATAEVKILKDGVALDTVKSEATIVSAASEKAISVKWNSGGRDIKSLDSEITVGFEGKTATSKIAAQKPVEEVKASGEQAQTSATHTENKTSSLTGAFAALGKSGGASAALVFIVIAAAIGAFLYFTKFQPPGIEEDGPITPLQPQTSQASSPRAKNWNEYLQRYYEYYYPDYYKKWKAYQSQRRQK